MLYSVHYIIYNEINTFINNINLKKKWNIDKKIYIENISTFNIVRCLGRVWDAKRGDSCDINKQCKQAACFDNLCERCFNKKTSSGQVNIMTDFSTIIKWYIKEVTYQQSIGNKLFKNRDINNEIELNNYKKYVHLKKIYKNVYYKKNKSMYQKIIPNKKVRIIKINKPSKHVIQLEKLSNDIYSDWWDSYMTDKVIIYDSINGAKCIFAIETTTDGTFLLNRRQVILGKSRIWKDIQNLIPSCFKNHDGEILHPETAIPIVEYEVYENKIYHNITPDIYREYRYDKNNETLCKTNLIELVK